MKKTLFTSSLALIFLLGASLATAELPSAEAEAPEARQGEVEVVTIAAEAVELCDGSATLDADQSGLVGEQDEPIQLWGPMGGGQCEVIMCTHDAQCEQECPTAGHQLCHPAGFCIYEF